MRVEGRNEPTSRPQLKRIQLRLLIRMARVVRPHSTPLTRRLVRLLYRLRGLPRLSAGCSLLFSLCDAAVAAQDTVVPSGSTARSVGGRSARHHITASAPIDPQQLNLPRLPQAAASASSSQSASASGSTSARSASAKHPSQPPGSQTQRERASNRSRTQHAESVSTANAEDDDDGALEGGAESKEGDA